jgi:hypothetical protein
VGISIKNSGAFFVMLAAWLVVAIAWPSPAQSRLCLFSWCLPKKEYVPCVNPARLKMGDRVFYIPRRWRINLTHMKPGTTKDLCHASDPTEVTEWAAFISPLIFVKGIEEFAKKNGYSSQPELQLQVYNETGKDFKPLYDNILKLMQLQNIRISDLPVENGFRVWRRKDWPYFDSRPHFEDSRISRENIYIADNSALLTSKEESAIFACTDFREFESCRVSIWDGQVDFTARGVDTRWIPKEKWKGIYRGLLKLRQSLLTNTVRTDFESSNQ